MIPYERLILERLDGDTPKEKYDNLVIIHKLLRKIAFPGRGTAEEDITVQEIADIIQTIMSYEKVLDGFYDAE